MTYLKQQWRNLPDQSTPLSASRLNHLETQFDEAVAYTDQAIATNPGPQGPEGPQGPPGPEGPQGPEGPPLSVTHRSKVHAGVTINIFTLNTGGVFIPGVVSRGVPGDPATPDKTKAKTPKQMSALFGYSFASNGSGWELSTGRILGANILDGVAYGSLGVPYQDNAAVAYCRDGKLRYYENALGDTTSKMLSDGAVHSWSWGPAIIKGGVPYNYSASGGWTGFGASIKSGRTVLSQTMSGDLVIFQAYGVSGSSGLTIPELTSALQGEGLELAVVLDSGGSSQSSWGGVIAHASSDAVSRPVPDSILFHAPPANSMSLPPVEVPAIAPMTGTLQVSLNAGRAFVTGALYGDRATPGAFVVTAASSTPPFVKSVRGAGAVSFSAGKTGVFGLVSSSGTPVFRLVSGYSDGFSNADISFEFDPYIGMD